jgi:hypothetical protein
MSVLEAMAYGLPTVAFDCAPGVRELLTDGHDGLLIWPGDTVGFAAALDRLIGDEELRRELGGHARVSVRRFDPEPVLDRWEHLFSLLDRRPGTERRVPVTVKSPAADAAADPRTRDSADAGSATEDAADAAREQGRTVPDVTPAAR